MRTRAIYHQFKPNEYFIDDKPVTEAEYQKASSKKPIGVPMLAGNSTTGWPLRMESLAVHPSQVPAVLERNRKHGIHVQYDKHGTPIVGDRGTRRELMKLENRCIPGGVRDRSGGYGDDFTSDALPKPKPKLSKAFIEDGVKMNEKAMKKAAIKKFTGKE